MVAIEKVAPRQSFLIFTGFETGDDFSWMGGEIPMDDVPRKKNNPSKEPQKSGDDPDAGGLACVGVDTCVCAIGQKRSNRCKYFLLSFEHSPPHTRDIRVRGGHFKGQVLLFSLTGLQQRGGHTENFIRNNVELSSVRIMLLVGCVHGSNSISIVCRGVGGERTFTRSRHKESLIAVLAKLTVPLFQI